MKNQTAEEFLNDLQVSFEHPETREIIIGLMNTFAKEKCDEQKEICAKVGYKGTYNTDEEGEEWFEIQIDEQAILNAPYPTKL